MSQRERQRDDGRCGPAPGRRVYRSRPMVWVGPLLVGALWLAFAPTVRPASALLVLAAVTALPCLALLLISWRARTVIGPDGVRLYPWAGRSRFIAWSEVEEVGIRPYGRTQAAAIVLRAGGRDTVVPAPTPSRYTTRYANQAVADLTAAWQAS
ncbi:PH domain-containing protein [Dactylosporangium sp. McL0621]|uniref:PH domain-containing protein n=1 Tax=Dactylosporangium sp. McL0621 TaxID=3415678 RepID=UPI003CF01B65